MRKRPNASRKIFSDESYVIIDVRAVDRGIRAVDRDVDESEVRSAMWVRKFEYKIGPPQRVGQSWAWLWGGRFGAGHNVFSSGYFEPVVPGGDVAHPSPTTEDGEAARQRRQRSNDIFRSLGVIQKLGRHERKQVLEQDVLTSPLWKGRGEEDIKDSKRISSFLRAHHQVAIALDVDDSERLTQKTSSLPRLLEKVRTLAYRERHGGLSVTNTALFFYAVLVKDNEKWAGCSTLDGVQSAGSISAAGGSGAQSVGSISAAGGSGAQSAGSIFAAGGSGAQSAGSIFVAGGSGAQSGEGSEVQLEEGSEVQSGEGSMAAGSSMVGTGSSAAGAGSMVGEASAVQSAGSSMAAEGSTAGSGV